RDRSRRRACPPGIPSDALRGHQPLCSVTSMNILSRWPGLRTFSAATPFHWLISVTDTRNRREMEYSEWPGRTTYVTCRTCGRWKASRAAASEPLRAARAAAGVASARAVAVRDTGVATDAAGAEVEADVCAAAAGSFVQTTSSRPTLSVSPGAIE